MSEPAAPTTATTSWRAHLPLIALAVVSGAAIVYLWRELQRARQGLMPTGKQTQGKEGGSESQQRKRVSFDLGDSGDLGEIDGRGEAGGIDGIGGYVEVDEAAAPADDTDAEEAGSEPAELSDGDGARNSWAAGTPSSQRELGVRRRHSRGRRAGALDPAE